MKKFFKFFVPILLIVIFVICPELLSYQHQTSKKSSQIEHQEFSEEAKIISSSDKGLWGKEKQIKLIENLSIGKVDGDETEIFSYIEDITIDGHDNLYVADGYEKTIKVYNTQGKFIKKFGRDGKGPGEFNNLDDIHWCSFDSLLYVIDHKNHRISQFSIDGTYINGFTMNNLKMRVERISSFDNGYFALAGRVIGRDKIDQKIIIVNHSFKNIISETQVNFPIHSVGMEVAPPFSDVGIINGSQLYYCSPSEYKVIITNENLVEQKILLKSHPKMFIPQYVSGAYFDFNSIKPLIKFNNMYIIGISYPDLDKIPLFYDKIKLGEFYWGDMSKGSLKCRIKSINQLDLFNTDFQFLISIPLPPDRYLADVDSQNRLYFIEKEPVPRIIRCNLIIK